MFWMMLWLKQQIKPARMICAEVKDERRINVCLNISQRRDDSFVLFL